MAASGIGSYLTDASGNITAMTNMLAPLQPFKAKLLIGRHRHDVVREEPEQPCTGKIDIGPGLRRHMLTGTAAIEDGRGGRPPAASIDQRRAASGQRRISVHRAGVQLVEN
jgi:hypothetical protein